MIGMEAQNYEIRQKGNFGKEIVENILKSVEEKKIDLLNLLSNCDTDEEVKIWIK